jgi:hypothetical protein
MVIIMKTKRTPKDPGEIELKKQLRELLERKFAPKGSRP